MAKISVEEINQVEKLNGVENFQLWKFEITILLKANDLYEVATEVSAVQDAAWLKKDANAQKEKQLYCKICKKNNHLEKDCFFRDKETKKKDQQTDKVSFLVHKQENTSSWIVDSGMTSHMTNKLEHLENFKQERSKVGVAKANESMLSKGTDLNSNLISVSAITDHEGEVIFTGKEVIIKKDREQILCGSKKENGLYEIELYTNKRESEEKSYAAYRLDSIKIWHKKLGHLSFNGMKILKEISKGMDFIAKDLKEVEATCEICLKAKQTRVPFEKSETKTKRPLELVHSNVCGPVETQTWNDKRYILTMLDDYTHFTVIYLLQNKYEVADTIKEYVKYAAAQWNTKLTRLRCDNGREYANKNLQN
ncbi:uncharacterized protein LOC105249334 [Camponotus floridanus]|uniref:uncharacterized protein LOC105249334 n=1 Tax=Camponotus floridanus TaxID=104421 RepID=UPI000DC6C85E|nr:uncharacterized protein LOC105249334 [Camponotus floridanus]